MNARRLPFILGIIVSIGCQRTPYELAAVHGTVTIDGVPFADGKVMFAPVSKGGDISPGKPAFGRLQRDGSFVLSTYKDNDGAVVGEHTVTVIQIEPQVTEVANVSAGGGTAAMIPRFRRARVAGKFEVVRGKDNQFDIKLKQREIARYRTPD